MATAVIPIEELRDAALHNAPNIKLMLLRDGDRELRLLADLGRVRIPSSRSAIGPSGTAGS